jgi:hypothetical protein
MGFCDAHGDKPADFKACKGLDRGVASPQQKTKILVSVSDEADTRLERSMSYGTITVTL